MANAQQEVDLVGLLEQVRVGWGITTITGLPAKSCVQLGPVSDRSFAHSDSRNHRLSSIEYVAYGSSRDFQAIAEAKGVQLEHKSTADMDGPVYIHYVIKE